MDLVELGTKDCFCNIHYSKLSFREFLEEMKEDSESEIIEIDYVLAHNIIYGANAFAEEEFCIMPYPDFEICQYILMEDTEDIPLIDIEFGER